MYKLLSYIKEFWYIATTKTPLYEYIIVDIELRQRADFVNSIIYYRAIGARTVEQASARELNTSDVFFKFHPLQAQAIVTAATVESILVMDKETILTTHREYLKECTRVFKSR